MGRAPCCDENMGLKKGPWTPDEDQKLMDYIQMHGHGSWRSLPLQAGLSRCGKSCRLRWTNYLRPDIKRGRFSPEEEQTIIHLHALLGNRWSAIASHLPRRTDNEIKNYWNTHLKKRLLRMGIDPVTHQASSPLTLQAQQQHYHHSLLHLQGVHRRRSSSLIDSSEWKKVAAPTSSNYLTHMSQWDCVRAEAEARLASTTNLHLLSSNSVSTITTDLYASPWTPSFEDVKGLLLPVSRTGVDGATSDSGTSTHPVDVVTEAMNFRDHVEERMMSTSIPSCINPVDLQKFLQDWDSSLQPPSPNLQTCLTQSHVSTDDHTGGRQESSPCSSITRHSSSSFQSVGHYCEDMDAAEQQIQRSSSELFQESVDNVFSVDQYTSPTSTVSSNSRSPGATTIVAASEPGFMPAAPIHHEEVHHHHESDDDQKMVPSDMMVVSEVTTFWQRQQAAMVEAGLHQLVPDQCNFLPELEPLADRAAMEFGILPNHLSSQIPHFEFWCRGLHTDQNKLLTLESIGLGRTIL